MITIKDEEPLCELFASLIHLKDHLMVNARVMSASIADFATVLASHGYTLEGINPDGIGHRFSSAHLSIDLLAPDGLGNRANLITIAPARTVQVPGGTQALRRTQLFDIQAGLAEGSLPAPNLAGAILIKARAVEVDDLPNEQLKDLAFLLSIAPDPVAMREELTGNERKWLRARKELEARSSPAWRALEQDAAEDGYAVFRYLIDR